MTEEIRLKEGVMAEEIRVVEHYSASIPNKAGEGARVLGALRDAGVNLIAFWGYKHGAGERSSNLFPKTVQLLSPRRSTPSSGCVRVQRFTFTGTTAPVPLPISSRNLLGPASTLPQSRGSAVEGEATAQSCSSRQQLLSKLQAS
jgi:hypothetical protein